MGEGGGPSAEQMLQPVHVEADHHFVIHDNRRGRLAVQVDQLLQSLRIGGHILVFKGDLARAEEMFGSEARRASGLAVENDTFLRHT